MSSQAMEVVCESDSAASLDAMHGFHFCSLVILVGLFNHKKIHVRCCFTISEADDVTIVEPRPTRRLRRKTALTPRIPCVRKRRSELAGARLGITGVEYRSLRKLRVPCILYQLLFFLNTTLGPSVPDLDAIDWFAGVAHVQKELAKLGYATVAYERSQDWPNVHQHLFA